MDKSLEDLIERFVRIGQQNQPIKKYASTPGVDLPAAYILRHIYTGRIYVGSSGQVGYRMFKHKSFLRLNQHGSKELQEAYNLNSDIDFLVLITSNREEAFDLEQAMLDKYRDSGLLFNLSRNARRGNEGVAMSDENRLKLSIRSSQHKHSPESIAKMSLVQKGRVKSAEHIRKIHESRKGWKPSDEHARAVSVALTSVARTDEDKERIRLGSLKRSKAVLINSVEYASIRHAARILGLDKNKVKFRIKSSSPEFIEWKMKD